MKTTNPKAWKEKIKQLSVLPNPPALLLFGDPGTGKTRSSCDASKEVGRKYIPLSLGRLEAFDIKGMPKDVEGFMRWSIPCFWKEVVDCGGEAIVHFDEFTLASEEVQGAVLDVVLTKNIDSLQLPAKTMFIISGNKGGEDGTFAKVITSALTGGRGFVYEMKSPSVKEWIEFQNPLGKIKSFLMSHGIKALISAPDKAEPFNPWACARSWSQLDDLAKALKLDLEDSKDQSTLGEFAYGILNYDIASKLMQHVQESYIDPALLFQLDKGAWAKYKKATDLVRGGALGEVVQIVKNDPELKKAANFKLRVAAVQKFFDELVKSEPFKDNQVAFLTDLCNKDAFLYEEIKYGTQPAGAYLDKLLLDRLDSEGVKGTKK